MTYRNLIKVASAAVFSAARQRAVEGLGDDEDIGDSVSAVFTDIAADLGVRRHQPSVMIELMHRQIHRGPGAGKSHALRDAIRVVKWWRDPDQPFAR